MSRPLRPSARLRAILAALLLAATTTAAQDAPQLSPDGARGGGEAAAPDSAKAVDWDVQAEVSGSLFFGNTQQTVFATRAALGRSDSTVAFKSDLRFTYGEGSTEDNRDFVAKRSWLATVNMDLSPYAAVSPFLTANLESSLERRIDLRYSAGLGNQLRVVHTPESELKVSLALLGEWSRLVVVEQPELVRDALVRWSARVRLRHEITDQVTLQSETFYRPEVRATNRFTLTSSTSLGYAVRSWARLTVSFLDNYDSEAATRGARANNDGQLVVGVLTAF
ncbi:MAG TPA: DUF481 domain-containing protein [Gemmatimonadaceae bacterium]|nr:DUF481 domain-containing protein [Gemmatimonadaceae bacterium]